VKELVETTVARVTAGSSQVNQAGETMSEIIANTAGVQLIISDIARATTEQTRGIQEVNHAVTQLDGMVQQNAALVEETAAAATSLQAQASALAHSIGQFKTE
jgi:methyl-accepting chemotaxis protein